MGNQGFEDQFNLPQNLQKNSKLNYIKIVPFGDLPDSHLFSSKKDKQNAQEFAAAFDKGFGSTDKQSRIGQRLSSRRISRDPNQDQGSSGFMQPSMPRYTYGEDRPQTRGNQSHAASASGTAASGTRGGRRSRRIPQNKILDDLTPHTSQVLICKEPRGAIANRFTHLNSNQFSPPVPGIGVGPDPLGMKIETNHQGALLNDQ